MLLLAKDHAELFDDLVLYSHVVDEIRQISGLLPELLVLLDDHFFELALHDNLLVYCLDEPILFLDFDFLAIDLALTGLDLVSKSVDGLSEFFDEFLLLEGLSLLDCFGDSRLIKLLLQL